MTRLARAIVAPKPTAEMITAPEYQARITERQWRELIRQTAMAHRWVVLFELPDAAYRMLAEEARTNPGQEHLLPPEGWPDFVFGRDEVPDRQSRTLFVELKTNKGSASKAQIATLDTLVLSGCETYLWMPRDWDEIVRVLR